MAGTAQRIKGQEVALDIIVDGVVMGSIGPASSFEAEFMMDILSEGYIGETTERKDSIFKGVKGSASLHMNDAQTFTLIQTAVDKARRRTPGVAINAKAAMRFPNGQVVRVLFPALEFGAMPVDFGSREDYGELKLEWECSEATILPA